MRTCIIVLNRCRQVAFRIGGGCRRESIVQCKIGVFVARRGLGIISPRVIIDGPVRRLVVR
jgi:hypothetical protein